jgi:hypothetical protein
MTIAPFAAGGAPIIGRRRKRKPPPIFGGGGQAADVLASGAAYFNMLSGALDPRLVFTRASDAWYLDSDGLWKVAVTDQPRFDYNYKTPGAPVNRGLIIENAATNLCLWSRDLTNAAWVKTSVTALKDQVGIDGVVNSASRITATGANGTCLQAITQALANRSYSLFIKRLVGSGTIQITHDNGATWTTVTVTAAWTRVHLTQSIANSNVGIRIVTSGDSVAVDLCQDEVRPQPSSPIETTSATVTRASEDCDCTGTDFSDWFVNAAPGTIIVEWSQPYGTVLATRSILAINDNTNNEAYNFLADVAAGTGRIQHIDGGVSLASNDVGTPSNDAVHRWGRAFDVASTYANFDGTATSTANTPTLPTVNRMQVGKFSTGISRGNVCIQRISYFDRKLSAAELDVACTL